jgi:RND family efflux transporter MFP subunit
MITRFRVSASILIGTSLTLAAVSCGPGKESGIAGDAVLRPVRVNLVSTSRERVRIDLAGELVSHDRIQIATKVAGRILELPVTEGTSVRRGQVLARLDSPELQSAFAQSRAAEEAARLNAEVSVRQAERFRRLAAGQVVTARDLEMTEVAAAAALATHAQAKAMSEMSRENLEYAVLRAPHDGVVVRRTANPGDLALPGQPVLVMEDDGDLEVRVTLAAEIGWPIAPGDSASLIVALGNPSPVPATIDRVSPSADGHAILAYVKAAGLRAPTGSFVRVSLFGPESLESIRVPEESLVRRGPLTGAFLVREGRAVLRWLRLTPDGRLAAGLAPGDSLVVTPPADLEDGDRVEAIR